MKSKRSSIGKYDDICETIIMGLEADAVIVIVAQGVMGSGFSFSARDPRMVDKVPKVLRELADMIEADTKATMEPRI